MWLVLGKDYLLTFPNRSARCLYTVTGRDRVGFSDGEEPPPITCVAARKIVKSPGTEAESPIVPVIPYAKKLMLAQSTPFTHATGKSMTGAGVKKCKRRATSRSTAD